ncbi:DNA/RNA non-specific endonuclease [Pararhodobacter sp.]|uniref:DNA/RNA non-specific endonuclease n=1 Tax=Pararhodobacter sp. TaxID=2127056 RepID=UPI002AFF4D16|nr:DNA/RNA non-specific endonuclease [Pararhodobacter sp.]
MSRKKSRRRPTKPKKSVRSRSRAFFVSFAVSFVVASCAINPQLLDRIPIGPILTEIGLSSPAQSPAQVVATGARIQTSFGQCRQFFPGKQPPSVPSGPALRELCYDAFAILYSGRTKTSVFVAQGLNRGMLQQAQGISRTDRFFADARLPRSERAELDDYRGSGYDRGHMAPAGDMHTNEAMAQSFSLANIVPQDAQHNREAWSQIEADTRKYVMRARGNVYVFTGPLYIGQPQTIGAGRVAVPTHLFKLVYDATTGRSWVHWHTNSQNTKVGPPISYEEFVRRTGLQLLETA